MTKAKDVAKKVADKLTDNYCSQCSINPKEEPHICPYADEINGDSKTLCDCCVDCTHNCSMEI